MNSVALAILNKDLFIDIESRVRKSVSSDEAVLSMAGKLINHLPKIEQRSVISEIVFQFVHM